MRTSNLPLNVRVTIEIQDEKYNKHVKSAPATVEPGTTIREFQIQDAINDALLRLGADQCITHTAKLIRG